jgi:hypothetical protein
VQAEMTIGAAIAVFMALGVALFVETESVVWIPVGVAMGIAIGAGTSHNKNGSQGTS